MKPNDNDNSIFDTPEIDFNTPGDKTGIFGSNVNTNPRTENTTINIGSDIFEFYKGFFDGIKSYERDFDRVQPWIKSEYQRSVNK